MMTGIIKYLKRIGRMTEMSDERKEAFAARVMLANCWSRVTTYSPGHLDRLLLLLKAAIDAADTMGVKEIEIYPAAGFYDSSTYPFRVIGYVAVFDNGWPDGKIYGLKNEAWECESTKPGFVRLAEVKEVGSHSHA